jgi:hypothetical protein
MVVGGVITWVVGALMTGAWTLDPRRTMTWFETNALWVLNLTGTLRATEGSGAVTAMGGSPVA